MRFVPDGPNLPSELLRKWMVGEVLFLAGAGVSAGQPANLPAFRRLAAGVYTELHDPLGPLLQSICNDPTLGIPAASEARLAANERLEVKLFISGEFDRLFSALETRIDRDAAGRFISRRVRNHVETLLRRHGGHCQGHRDLLRLSLAPPAGTAAREACRIATTNFDLLFEEAWPVELGFPAQSFDCRLAPRGGASNFSGIVHLHGLLSPYGSSPSDLVLSSRDFARVYLRSGSVGNYVYDLVRRYTVVLVGYSADDPTMRYLMDAIDEDVSLFGDMHRPYAIAALESGTLDLAEQNWRNKSIEPILYAPRSGPHRFGPLWETISEWAQWKRRGDAWIDDRLHRATAAPARETPSEEIDFVRDLLSVLEPSERERAVDVLVAARRSFDWIEVLDSVDDAAAGAGVTR